MLACALSMLSLLLRTSAGTHLGHNLPDGQGYRYCINLVSIAGNPEEDDGRVLL
jgi:peptide methionine sulfoxide reductase MsrB